MKRISIIVMIACMASVATEADAQSQYDANRLMQTDLNGTARFVGMGGAMGALGGDISTMGTNPAGIGIYRSNDAMISFGFNRSDSESSFSGNRMTDGRTAGSFDNAGFVYSTKIGSKTSLRYVNFGFNYHKAKSFNKRMVMGGDLWGTSQTDQMASQSDGLLSSDFDRRDVWNVNGIGWLSVLGWKGALTYTDENDERSYYGFPSESSPYGDYRATESGGINAYDFNIAFNMEDRVYFGFTLGVYDVDYSRHSWYREGFDYTEATGDRSFYTKEDYFQTTGAGIDFKFGIIVRPFETLPLRIGAAIHTPTLFNLRDRFDTALLSDIDYNLDGDVKQYDVFTPDGGALTEYSIVTPWKYNLSLGYTVGASLAVGAEYEFCNYSTAKIKDYDGTLMGEYDAVNTKQFLKGVHTMRFGLEYKPVPQLSVRAGYNRATASVEEDAYKLIPYEGPNSVRTDTEYANTKAINNYTVGMGYRGNMFYADLSYQYKTYKEDFYPFDHVDLPATKVTNSRHQLLMTLGVRF